jgi:hypothetical protein
MEKGEALDGFQDGRSKSIHSIEDFTAKTLSSQRETRFSRNFSRKLSSFSP